MGDGRARGGFLNCGEAKEGSRRDASVLRYLAVNPAASNEFLEVGAVVGLAELGDGGVEAGASEPALAETDFFEAGDLETLAVFDDGDELAGFEERVVRAGVEPRGAAAEDFDVEVAPLKIEAVEIGDLEFAALGGLEATSEGDDIGVVEIDAGDGVVGFRLRGFFLEGNDATIRRELDDTVALGIGDVVAEDRGARGARAGGGERFYKIVAVEKIVAEDEGGGLAFEEADVGGDVEGLRETVGAGLLGVGEADAELRAVAEEAAEEREIGGRRDDEDFLNAGEHQHGQWVINHRLVVDRHELFRDRDGEGKEARA
jgi:hypothetical protein